MCCAGAAQGGSVCLSPCFCASYAIHIHNTHTDIHTHILEEEKTNNRGQTL